MDDFLLGILGVLFEVFGEFLAELAVELLTSLVARGVRNSSRRLRVWIAARAELDRPALVACSLVVGVIAGCFTVFLHPTPWLHPGKIHGISLILSPALTGLAMACIGSTLRLRNRKSVPWESFWGGFAFALGMAVIRFVGTR